MSNGQYQQQHTEGEVETASIRVLLLRAEASDIPIDLDDFPPPNDIEGFEDAVMEVVGYFTKERASALLWIRLVEEVWRFNKFRMALEILDRALEMDKFDSESRIPLYCLMANYFMALARKAPKLILKAPRSNNGQRLQHSTHIDHPEYVMNDPTLPPLTRDEYLKRAGDALRKAEQIEGRIPRGKERDMVMYPIILDVRAAHAIISGRFDDALKLFDRILNREPTNLPALMGRARCLFGKKSYRLSLKSYQTVLAFAPNLLPDPRIGIGLCMFMLGETNNARLAWERSIVANPDSNSNTAQTLLALFHIHGSKAGSDEGRSAAYKIGIQYAQAAFKIDNTSATAAATLASFFAITREHDKVIKLGERAVQYADNTILRSDAHLVIARLLQQQPGREKGATEEYQQAIRINPEQTPAQLAIAQSQIAKGDFAPATDSLEMVLRRQPQCIEALISLAAIHTHQAFTSLEVVYSKEQQKKAKELYDQVLRLFAAAKDTSTEVAAEPKVASLRIDEVSHDPEMYIEIAKLFSDEANLDRSLKCYQEAARITSEELHLPVSPKILNNTGVLEYMRGNFLGAQDKFEEAATEAGNMISKEGRATDELDAVITAVTFNLGVVYEALGEKEKAKSAFNQIISRHPEYVDSKAHLALMAISIKKFDEAHNYIKEALTSQPKNVDLRSLYTYFLVQTGAFKLASDFTLDTLKTFGRHDVYSLCATGMLTYNRIRENKATTKDADQDRATRYLRTAEYYEKALTLDPLCAFAAQGLAISIAEGTLGTGIEGTAAIGLTDPAQKAKNSRDALTILTKVKGSINDGSVYINIGHCHFVREEWERAIESYETASKRYFHGKNVNCLLYLSRSWYHKANKDQNFSDFQSALAASKKALELLPNDLSITFNVAMIQQKGAEILYDLPAQRRTLGELKQALEDANSSQILFDRLVNNAADETPYARELPKQRHSYGISLLKKAAKELISQEEYELEEQARLNKAKEIRDLERKRIADAEELRLAELAKQAAALAEQRRVMGEESAAWLASKKYDSDDEEDKKSKKRKSKLKKEEDEGEEESGEDDEKPKKKKPKASSSKKSKKSRASEGSTEPQEMELDEDGEEKVGAKKRKGKAFKSKEFIVDSDSESGGEPEGSVEREVNSDAAEEADAVESESGDAGSAKEDE